MSQFNLQLSPEFERTLDRLVAIRRFRSKSEAVRTVVREALEQALGQQPHPGYSRLRGLARGPSNPAPRFHSDEDLWR